VTVRYADHPVVAARSSWPGTQVYNRVVPNVQKKRRRAASDSLSADERNDPQRQELRGGLRKEFTAVIERDPRTGLYVGYVPGFRGAHSQAETLDELNRNLREVIDMILEDGEPTLDGEFIGTQRVSIA
jgi:predicted RNase H-like HicB family nuclease